MIARSKSLPWDLAGLVPIGTVQHYLLRYSFAPSDRSVFAQNHELAAYFSVAQKMLVHGRSECLVEMRRQLARGTAFCRGSPIGRTSRAQ